MYILAAGFVIALSGIALFTWIFYSSMQQLQQVGDKLYAHPITVSRAAQNLKVDLYQMHGALMFAALAQAGSTDLAILDQQLAEQAQHMQAQVRTIRSRFRGDKRQVDMLEKQLQQWLTLCHAVMQQLQQQHYAEAQHALISQARALFSQVLATNAYVLTYATDRLNLSMLENEAQLKQHTAKGLMFATLILTAFVILSLVIAWRLRVLHLEVDRFAFTDFLTGIANRRSFMADLESEIQRVQRYGGAFSLAMVDIDRFKQINDLYGHQFGDRVLQNFCVQCVNALRTSDVVGRLGGEEFGILMPMTELNEAAKVLERLRADIDHSELTENGHNVHYTASFGLVCVYPQQPATTLSQVIKVVDKALYTAKQQGRNRVCIAPAASFLQS